MASGVNVKMGVSGVSQFRQNIKTAQNSVKTLDEQLKLNEKQFRANGDSQEYMATKTQLLQKKIEEQKAIVSQAEKALKSMSDQGVDKASASFQKMQQEMLRAKGELLDAQSQMNGIETAGDNAANGVSDMNNQLSNIGKQVSFETVTNGIDRITKGLENAAKKALRVGQAITREVLGAGGWADDLTTRATYYQIDQETLQRMEKTAGLIDTPVDAIIDAQKKLRNGIGTEDKGVMGAFAELMGEGYDPRNNGWEKAFWDAGEALMRFGDEEEKEVYAQKLFGRSWNELIPLFEAGKKEYDELNESWSVVSEEQIKSLTKMDDQYQKLTNEWETFKTTLLATLAGPLEGVMEKLTGFLEELNTYLQTDEGKETLQSITDAVGSLFEDLKNVDPKEAVGAIRTVVDGLVEGLKWIAEHHEDVVTGLKTIVVGWGALKLGGGALKVLQLIEGLKGLGFRGGNTVDIPAANGGGGAAGAGSIGAKLGGLFGNGGWAIGGAGAAELALGIYSLIGHYQNLKGWWTGYEQDEYHEGIDENERIMREEWERMNQVNEESASNTVRSTSEMTHAANDLKGLPSAVEDGVIRGMSGVTIVLDGEAVGRMMTPRVGGNMAGAISYLIK